MYQPCAAWFFVCLTFIFCAVTPPISLAAIHAVPGAGLETMPTPAYTAWMESLRPGSGDAGTVILHEPRCGAVLPANAAAPEISWSAPAGEVVLIRLVTASGDGIQALCRRSPWTPDPLSWETVRTAALGQDVHISVAPIGGENGRTILPGPSTQVRIDESTLTSPIAYLHLPIPFRKAKEHPQWAAWRQSYVSEYSPPQVFMTDLPVCANCHAYSTDGATMLLDMDIDGDKGGFVLAPVHADTTVTRDHCFSWNSMPPTPPSPFSFGLFASLSPDGRYAAATVGETSLFVMIDRDDYSQLFYPATGQIGIFDRATTRFSHMSGTTDPGFVHTGPRFSPDGQRLIFSRAPVRPDYVRAILDKRVMHESANTTIHELNARYPFQFDLYALPFPNAQDAAPTPLSGAAHNGQSNYFPRFSPDGRWIVFTQAPSGLVLQPDSKLMIIPSQGGEATALRCNTERMNSWHSWSPDGKWLVFSAKGKGAETELFLARMYANGTSSAPLRLHRLSMPGFACVVPEFCAAQTTRNVMQLGFPQQPVSATPHNVR